MKKLISILIVVSIFLTLCLGTVQTGAQKPNDDKKSSKPFELPKGIQKHWDQIPESAKRALTPEAKAKWDSFTPKQRDFLKGVVHRIIREQLAKASTAGQAKNSTGRGNPNLKRDPENLTVSFVDASGKHRQLVGTPGKNFMQTPGKVRRSPGDGAVSVWDSDWENNDAKTSP